MAATDLRDSKLGRLRKRLLAIGNEFRALCAVRRGRYAFIQVKDKTVASLLGLLVARATGTRFFFSLSFPFPEFFIHRAETGLVRFRWASRLRGEILRFLMYQTIMRFADHVIVQSEKMRTDVISEGVDHGKLSVLPMGVDTTYRVPAATAAAFDGRGSLLDWIGSAPSRERFLRVVATGRPRPRRSRRSRSS